jgi:hypothetical protein
MNSEMMIAFFELGLSALIGILTVFLVKTFLVRFYLKRTHENDPYKNLSFMIFLSGTIFAVSYLLFGIMDPLSATLKLLNAQDITMKDLVLSYIKYILMFLVLGYAFSASIIFSTYKIFALMTRNLDENEEIKNNNIGVAVLLAVLTIVAAMFSKGHFIIFIESFIPYPDVPSIM